MANLAVSIAVSVIVLVASIFGFVQLAKLRRLAIAQGAAGEVFHPKIVGPGFLISACFLAMITLAFCNVTGAKSL
jgi:hypothetical protein